MGVIDLDARVKKLEAGESGGVDPGVIDQLEAAVTDLEETVNGNGETDFGLVGDVAALESDVGDLQAEWPVNYSSTEVVVGKYVNGKPIYQKTVPYTFDNQSGQRTISIPHGVSNMETVVSIEGIMHYPGIVYGETFPSKDSAFGRVTVKTANIEIGITGSWEDYSLDITIRYTKSTDTGTT